MGDVRDQVLLQWVHLNTTYRQLSSNITREICDYLKALKALITTEGSAILFFHFDSDTWQPLFNFIRRVDIHSASLLYIDSQHVFACGGSSYSSFDTNAQELAVMLSPGGFEMLESMGKARWGHGLLQNAGEIYAFGGTSLASLAADVKLKQYEKYSLQGKIWGKGTEMVNSRAFFVVCRYADQVYLCGGGTRAVECFSLLHRSFTPLLFQLSEESSSLSTVQGYHLTVITQTHVGVWDVRDGHRVSSKKRPFGAVWSLCMPVVRAGCIYVVDFGICKGISLETGEITKEIQNAISPINSFR